MWKSVRAREIGGWMRGGALRWLEKNCRTCDLVIEIGTWLGRSTYAIGEVVRGKVITIDPFNPEGMLSKTQRVTYRRHYPVPREVIQKDPDFMWKMCISNLAPLIEKGKVEVIRGKSDDVINTLQHLRGTVDMVFIDGDHVYDAVKRDIMNYKPLIRPGSILCGHDYDRGVKKAVDELLPDAKSADGTIWVSYC